MTDADAARVAQIQGAGRRPDVPDDVRADIRWLCARLRDTRAERDRLRDLIIDVRVRSQAARSNGADLRDIYAAADRYIEELVR